jgi:hypothetical protein
MFTYPVTADFHTDAPPAAVWAAFEAVERWPEILPELISARIEPTGRLETGAVIRSVAGEPIMPLDIDYRVTLAQAPHRLTLEVEADDWRGRTDYTIAEDPGGAHVTVVSTMEVTGLLLRMQMLLSGRRMTEQRAAALRERTRALLTLAERLAQQS